MHGGPLSTPWAKAHVPAIIDAFYPGERGGTAIANILFGVSNPAGRLPYTVPQEDFIKRDMLNMDLRSAGGTTYKWLEAAPVYEFGAGGSYSSFAWQWDEPTRSSSAILLQTETLANEGELVLPVVVVRNTGKLNGDVVTLGMVSAGPTGFPHRALFDFARTAVAAGHSETVRLTLPAEALSVVSSGGQRWLRPHLAEFALQIGERDSLQPSDGGGAEVKVKLAGTPVRLPSYNWPLQRQ